MSMYFINPSSTRYPRGIITSSNFSFLFCAYKTYYEWYKNIATGVYCTSWYDFMNRQEESNSLKYVY